MTVEEGDNLFEFDPKARADMIDRALNENRNYDTEQSELGYDPSQDETSEILKDLDGSSSHRKTTENNNLILEETKALMA